MGCHSSKHGKENHPQKQTLKQSLQTFPAPLKVPPVLMHKQAPAEAKDINQWAEVAVTSINDLLQSSVLTDNNKRRALREVRTRLEDEDIEIKRKGLRALVELIEDLCNAHPEVCDYVDLSSIGLQRLEGSDIDKETTPSFGHIVSPRQDPELNGQSPADIFVETPRMISPIWIDGCSETPRGGILETPRFGQELLIEIDADFWVDTEGRCPKLENFHGRDSPGYRFASAPPGFDARRKQDGKMVFMIKRRP